MTLGYFKFLHYDILPFYNTGFPTYMAYQTAAATWQRNTTDTTEHQQSANTLVNGVQSTTTTTINNGSVPAAGAENRVPLRQVNKCISPPEIKRILQPYNKNISQPMN